MAAPDGVSLCGSRCGAGFSLCAASCFGGRRSGSGLAKSRPPGGGAARVRSPAGPCSGGSFDEDGPERDPPEVGAYVGRSFAGDASAERSGADCGRVSRGSLSRGPAGGLLSGASSRPSRRPDPKSNRGSDSGGRRGAPSSSSRSVILCVTSLSGQKSALRVNNSRLDR